MDLFVVAPNQANPSCRNPLEKVAGGVRVCWSWGSVRVLLSNLSSSQSGCRVLVRCRKVRRFLFLRLETFGRDRCTETHFRWLHTHFFTHRCTYLEVHNYAVDQFRNSHFDARPKHMLSLFAVIRNTSQPFHFAAVNFKYLIEIVDPSVSFRWSL